MIGAIIGDIIGSVYEGRPVKTTQFNLFNEHSHYTDDTVLTIAIAHSILERKDYKSSLKDFGKNYTAGYGAGFYNWVHSHNDAPYNSWGNGSAMRVSPIGFAFDTSEEVLSESKKSAEVTHNHPEGIKGAQATAFSIFLARNGASKNEIKKSISERFSYDLSRTIEGIRPEYYFKISCQESVPESIIAFLESNDFESAIRNAVSLGGDADTMACIAGGIAQAFYNHIPSTILLTARERLPDDFLKVIDAFNARYRTRC